MDISLQEDGQMATLEELFEFIDCCVCSVDCLNDSTAVPNCDVCNQSAGSCENELAPKPQSTAAKDTAQGSPTTIDRSSFHATEAQLKSKRRRIRTGWSSSTGLQRRKRAELQFLREHVRDLETYVESLKQRARPVPVLKDSCNWQEVVTTEFMERLKAEETNRRLKNIMNNQLQLRATLQLLVEQSAAT